MAATRRYEIRLFDRTLVEFSIMDGPFGPDVLLEDWDETARPLMPAGLSPDGEGIWRWLEARSIPINRHHAERVCHRLGLRPNDTEALYTWCLGLSLNDAYWVVPRGFTGRFKDHNLYQNPFDEAIGALALTGSTNSYDLHGPTPELTTDGTLPKGWRITDGTRVLYKGAGQQMPGEPLSEYLASIVAHNLGMDAVTYGLDTWENTVCSTCACFATPEVSYVPFAVATGCSDLASVLWWCATQGREHLERLCDMLTLDALLANVDRHLTNFGVLRDNGSGHAIGLAPLFDHGRALFPSVADDDPKQFALEARLRRPAFGARSFQELIARVAGERQHVLLRKAAQYGIGAAPRAQKHRVAALDGFLRQWAKELDTIEVVDHKELMEELTKAMGRRSAREDRTFRIGFFSVTDSHERAHRQLVSQL